jgi:hypothetical protein
MPTAELSRNLMNPTGCCILFGVQCCCKTKGWHRLGTHRIAVVARGRYPTIIPLYHVELAPSEHDRAEQKGAEHGIM